MDFGIDDFFNPLILESDESQFRQAAIRQMNGFTGCYLIRVIGEIRGNPRFRQAPRHG
jgi:hypothetical protein